MLKIGNQQGKKLSKKLFGFSWFDFKTKGKKIARSIFYTDFGKAFICVIIAAYIRLVYLTSRKIMVAEDLFADLVRQKQPMIVALWHSRIMLAPMIVTKRMYKIEKKRRFFCLSSKHGDGQSVGKVMERLGFVNIAGSSQDGRKASRGINVADFKKIFKALKSQMGITITPDGPRGPAQKINGEIVKIANIAKAPILTFACGYSKFITLNSWDKFKMPLPFGTICYYSHELIWPHKILGKDFDDEDVQKLNLELEEQINEATKKADKICGIN